jgi:hypothetical protein
MENGIAEEKAKQQVSVTSMVILLSNSKCHMSL